VTVPIRARLVKRAEEIQRQLSWIDAEIRSSSQVVVKRVPELAVWSRRPAIDSYDQADILLNFGRWRAAHSVRMKPHRR
jgi:hypothetical protein